MRREGGVRVEEGGRRGWGWGKGERERHSKGKGRGNEIEGGCG